ncbi:phenylacetate--CoA ligase family protein [Thermoflexus hugenholtzii]|jgi:phenylacetate-CoA ligase (EC 6.2.1.30)|uniref:Phenylacetate-coenzyme A ligase n=1 Tax=Thermoflexus hugenholtzii JAD2 TaxID=877466 RepID=A0A212RQU7_9CHLR|nr:phenylacetate--CoA ligase [Thermoflexus hugenholtzii]SNB74912.1 phenylacetate-CoA ligase [Thermoflexus hugenholtzii JAD2]
MAVQAKPMYWNEEMETMPRDRLERLQLERLQRIVDYVYHRVPHYRRKMDEAGVKPSDIRHLQDITKLPFTSKADLRETYPFGMFAVPLNQVIRIHASSGTTGKPTVVGYTRNDLEVWAEVCARCLVLSGARPGEVFQNAYGYGLFTGGLGMHYGAEKLGMVVVPVSGGNTSRQLMILKDFGTHVMACTPSYALVIADALLSNGYRPGDLNLRVFILGAEPWTEGMRREIEEKLGVHAVNIYGLSEVIGPGVSNECIEAKNGSHIFEDHFLVEVVNPATGEPVPPGTVGELVFTTLTKEAMPVIRYRTGDLASIDPTPCVCGRTFVRMSRVLGRTDDMLIIRGVNVFPSQVEAALVGLPHVAPHYQLVVTREGRLDQLEVKVEVTEAFFREVGGELLAGEVFESIEAVQGLREKVNQVLDEALGIHVKVTLTPPNTLPRSEGGKLRRVVDMRPKDA